jgi:acetoin utilization protein AcuB
MLVGERMSKPVITVHPDIPVPDALNLMHSEHVRRVPVVDKHGHLVGIVTEQDLLNASASNVTTLSVWELGYLLNKITIQQVMTKQVVTINEDTPVEEAARVMADKHISGLPVVRGQEVVGMISESDLFKLLLEVFGARQPGIRVTIEAENRPGKLLELSQAIAGLGGNIISLGTFLGETSGSSSILLKVANVSLEDLQRVLTPLVERIIDIRSTK